MSGESAAAGNILFEEKTAFEVSEVWERSRGIHK